MLVALLFHQQMIKNSPTLQTKLVDNYEVLEDKLKSKIYAPIQGTSIQRMTKNITFKALVLCKTSTKRHNFRWKNFPDHTFY